MGTRLVYEIVTDEAEEARPVAILFSNSSHPDQVPDRVFEALAREAIGPTDLLRRLMGEVYRTPGGNHREGDGLFSLVQDAYGDAEEVLRVRYEYGRAKSRAVVTRRPNEDETPVPRM